MCSPTYRITSNCSCRAYDGNTGRSSAVGATRATKWPTLVCPSSVQVASRTIVSEDIPLASMPLRSTTEGVAPSGSTVPSQPANLSASSPPSRLDRCIFMSAGGGTWVTRPPSLEHVLKVNGAWLSTKWLTAAQRTGP